MASQTLEPARFDVVQGKCPSTEQLGIACICRTDGVTVWIEVEGGRFKPGETERLKCRVVGMHASGWDKSLWRVTVDQISSGRLARRLVGSLDTYLRTGWLEESVEEPEG